MPRLIDLTGQTFGKWYVVERVESRIKSNGRKGSAYWLCECECGNRNVVSSSNLRLGHSSRCTSCRARQPRQGRLVGEASRTKVLRQYKRGARDRSLSWNLLDEEFYQLVSLDCFYCGIPPCSTTYGGHGEFVHNGIDRLDSLLGYSIENVVTACKTCNFAKREMSYEDFMSWIARLTSYQARRAEAPPRLAEEVV